MPGLFSSFNGGSDEFQNSDLKFKVGHSIEHAEPAHLPRFRWEGKASEGLPTLRQIASISSFHIVSSDSDVANTIFREERQGASSDFRFDGAALKPKDKS